MRRGARASLSVALVLALGAACTGSRGPGGGGGGGSTVAAATRAMTETPPPPETPTPTPTPTDADVPSVPVPAEAPPVTVDLPADLPVGVGVGIGVGDPTSSSPPIADAPVETVTITLSVDPPKRARVLWGAKDLGLAPLEIRRPRGSGPLDLELRAPGFLTWHTRAFTDRNERIAIRMLPEAEAPRVLGYRPPPDAPTGAKPDVGSGAKARRRIDVRNAAPQAADTRVRAAPSDFPAK